MQDIRKKKDLGKKKSIKLFVIFVKTTIMKIELIKETNFIGEEWYYVVLDGKYVTGSGTSKEEKALEYYEFIKEHKSNKTTEVIKQTEI
jgi:hypothetical protein